VIRPGLIVGRYDPTDRFTYWPHRVARGGQVLAPDAPDGRTQIIDALDLASWTLHMAEERATGVFNATGPNTPLTMGRLLDECRSVSGSDATFTWVPGQFLLDHEVQPWSEMPLWVPAIDEYAGFNDVDISRALARGLTFRPIADTIRDTLDWDASRPPEPLRAGISRDRERSLLHAWHATSHPQPLP
jgi:2'-hydroxyisoflavone reductase